MQQMKIRCTSREHADRAVAAAKESGYRVNCLQIDSAGHDTLFLHSNGRAGFWPWHTIWLNHYPEYALYGDHLLPVSEGWIEWGGGKCPVRPHQFVFVIDEDGNESGYPEAAGAVDWDKVVEYRLADRQQPAEDKAELTPCQERGLKVGQWVWFAANIVPRWIQLRRDDVEGAPHFNCDDSTIALDLRYIDFTQGIHDSKPDWTPSEQAPVEWDGRDVPVVGQRVVISGHATGGDEVSGVIVLPPDSDGDYVIRSDEGVYWTESANSLRPIQSERAKATADIERIILDGLGRGLLVENMASEIYDAGYRKTENNNE